MQADTLRLLDASSAVVNTLLACLWPLLDEFMSQRSGPAWKQVVVMTGSPDPHGAISNYLLRLQRGYREYVMNTEKDWLYYLGRLRKI